MSTQKTALGLQIKWLEERISSIKWSMRQSAFDNQTVKMLGVSLKAFEESLERAKELIPVEREQRKRMFFDGYSHGKRDHYSNKSAMEQFTKKYGTDEQN